MKQTRTAICGSEPILCLTQSRSTPLSILDNHALKREAVRRAEWVELPT